MKNCWEILGIEPTTDEESIRQVYLSLLPSFHPESDPQGFKQLRQAYEEALQQSKSAANPVMALDADSQQINEILEQFRDLLACDKRRFQQSAWQLFIQEINTLSITLVEKLRWPLCAVAMDANIVSYDCLTLLADRFNWKLLDAGSTLNHEKLENFISCINHGDIFDYALLATLPVAIQDRTIACYMALQRTFFARPDVFTQIASQHGAMVVPDAPTLHRLMLRWYSSLQWGNCALISVAKTWREEEPENGSPHYYECAQRMFCGEGESLKAELCELWQQSPSSHVGNLLLKWTWLHQPGDYPLVVMAVEKHEQRDEQGTPIPYFHGKSARTRLLLAEALHSNRLPPLARSFVMHCLQPSAPGLNNKYLSDPRWSLYVVADLLVRNKSPKTKHYFPLVKRLMGESLCPFEALITNALVAPGAEIEPAEQEEERRTVANGSESTSQSEQKTPGVLSYVKVIVCILLIASALSRLLHLFT